MPVSVQAIEQVVHSQDALQLLLPQGDFAGALDIMDDIQVSSQLKLIVELCQCAA